MTMMKKLLFLEDPEKHPQRLGLNSLAEEVKNTSERNGWESVNVFNIPYADIRLARGDISLVVVHHELDMDWDVALSELRKNHPHLKFAGYSGAVSETSDNEVRAFFRKQYDYVLESIPGNLPRIIQELEEQARRKT